MMSHQLQVTIQSCTSTLQASESLGPRHGIRQTGTGNVQTARERSCVYTRKYVFAVPVPGGFLVVSSSTSNSGAADGHDLCLERYMFCSVTKTEIQISLGVGSKIRSAHVNMWACDSAQRNQHLQSGRLDNASPPIRDYFRRVPSPKSTQAEVLPNWQRVTAYKL